MRCVDYDGLLAAMGQPVRFVIERVEFAEADEWHGNRGPRCQHVQKGGVDVLDRRLRKAGGELGQGAAQAMRERSDRDGFADIKCFWLRDGEKVSEKDVRLTLALSPERAAALAVFIERLALSDCAVKCSEGESEAGLPYAMLSALFDVGELLAKAGGDSQ